MARVLVVDDEPDIVLFAQVNLELNGHEVRTAADGEQAMAAVEEERPDAMVLDVMIPKMDGFEVCRTLHNDPKTSHIKIVMLTALNRKIDMDAAKAAGAADYVIKPFDTRKLIKKIQQLVRP